MPLDTYNETSEIFSEFEKLQPPTQDFFSPFAYFFNTTEISLDGFLIEKKKTTNNKNRFHIEAKASKPTTLDMVYFYCKCK